MIASKSTLKQQRSPDTQLLREDQVRIGSDIIELVSSAMYIDPMSIFREYVQNAADAIDVARAADTLKPDEPGRVDIEFSPASRSVTIRDNGCGLASDAFVERLAGLGASTKRGTRARGFRGIGRLAGLAYAQQLIFRSRTSPDEPVRELRWDGRALKSRMAASTDSDVRTLIGAIVQLAERDSADFPARFFEVELVGLVRLRGDPLLNPSAIADYLSQVAPVPFSPDFTWGAKITDWLQQRLEVTPLNISVAGHGGPLCRPHRDTVPNGNKPALAVRDVSFIEVPDVDGEIGAVGWVLHHDYDGALVNATLQKGFRLRSGNIQVGADSLLEQEFPEARFNSWTIGEAHVLDRRIVPNGRRDHFEQNAHYNNLVNHLAPTFRDIAHRCRTSSLERKKQREAELMLDAAESGLELLRQNGVGSSTRTKLVRDLEGQVTKVKALVEAGLMRPMLLERANVVASALESMTSGELIDPLAHLKPADRRRYQEFFALIYECSQNRAAAKSLVDRIIARLAA